MTVHWRELLDFDDNRLIIEHMIENLTRIFDRIVAAGLNLKPKKCVLFSRKVLYLGHVITEHGISTDPEKMQGVKHWPEPCNLTEIRWFLGIYGYYRRIIDKFGKKAKPLTKLTEKGKAFV